MKTLYLDIFSGISGDMFIGALIDLGVDPRRLELELQKLRLEGYHLHMSRGQKASISGIKFGVHVSAGEHGESGGHRHMSPALEHHHHHDHEPHDHGHHENDHQHQDEDQEPHAHSHEHDEPTHHHGRTFREIKQLITESGLSDWVKQRSIAVFQRIAVAEGKIHGVPAEEVHFHEVGAVDSIVDIVGSSIGLELLGKPRVLAGPVVEGTGWINCAHGRFPVPAPATLAILGARGIPLSQCDEPHELITPTGAALLAEFAESFGPMRNVVAEKIGFGLGQRNNKTRPNVLRAILGEASEGGGSHDWQTDSVAVLEANLDDLNPEILGYFIEKALGVGALDVFYTPVQMKKNRPGTLLTVLCAEADADQFSELILRETSTFGVRRALSERRKLTREFTTVQTAYGGVKVKLGKLDGKILQAAPEFDSCRKLAEDAKVPLKEVYEAASKGLKP